MPVDRLLTDLVRDGNNIRGGWARGTKNNMVKRQLLLLFIDDYEDDDGSLMNLCTAAIGEELPNRLLVVISQG